MNDWEDRNRASMDPLYTPQTPAGWQEVELRDDLNRLALKAREKKKAKAAEATEKKRAEAEAAEKKRHAKAQVRGKPTQKGNTPPTSSRGNGRSFWLVVAIGVGIYFYNKSQPHASPSAGPNVKRTEATANSPLVFRDLQGNIVAQGTFTVPRNYWRMRTGEDRIVPSQTDWTWSLNSSSPPFPADIPLGTHPCKVTDCSVAELEYARGISDLRCIRSRL